MKNYAPIVIFTYLRLKTLKKTIEYLKKNKLSKSTNLIIFSDGSRSAIDKSQVEQVRNYIKKIKGFKKVTINLRKKNYGLAKNIKKGVTEVINRFGKAIILEDDIIVSNNFLNYMNLALDFYKDQKKVWHINAWNFSNHKECEKGNEYYFSRLMNCWGWATWKDRWKYFDDNKKKTYNSFSKKEIYDFNINNKFNYWQQIEKNLNNQINSWAIFWYASIFKNGGLCLTPQKTLSHNIGYDSFSQNIPNEKNIFKNIPRSFFNKNDKKIYFSKHIVEDKNNLRSIERIISKKTKKSFLTRLKVKISNRLNFLSFEKANFFSKYFLFSNYNSINVNEFKVQSFKNQKNDFNIIDSPSLKLFFDSINFYKKHYGKFPKTILDFGGGLGENILVLRKLFGIKISCTIIENKTLVEILKKNKINHCKFYSNLEGINKYKEFDLVICSASLEYVKNADQTLDKLKNFTNKLIVIGRINLGDDKYFKIQSSTLEQNVPYIENLPHNKKKMIFYPYRNLSLKKLINNLKSFKIIYKKKDQNNKLNIIFKKI
tara:strand:+ start:746 stop:2374 length:1629 start_codon:yes stop_codon:yes gene_type:complete